MPKLILPPSEGIPFPLFPSHLRFLRYSLDFLAMTSANCTTSSLSNGTISFFDPTGPFEGLDGKHVLISMLVGVVAEAMLYGALCVLTWRYARMSNIADPWWFKMLVAIGWILCTISLGTTSSALWYINNSIPVINYPWTVNFFLLLNGTVVTIARLLFVQRTWLLYRVLSLHRGHAVYMAGLALAVLLTLVELATSMWLCAQLYIQDMSHRRLPDLRAAFFVVFVAGTIADIIVTSVRCIWWHRARTGIKSTDTILNSMIVYTVETGLLPSIINGIGLFLLLANNSSGSFLAFYMQAGTLYLLSLLTYLNARSVVRQRRDDQRISINFSVLETTGDALMTSVHPFRASGSAVPTVLSRPAPVRKSSSLKFSTDPERPLEGVELDGTEVSGSWSSGEDGNELSTSFIVPTPMVSDATMSTVRVRSE
ncbi:hypothetical protein C8Q79DRAFT_962364 [Trametes meyenii]|nr:hypothetical protein C8Q79DRAFT_962364 [Trametes meyenii]